jgi:hypothetical protein
MTVEVHQVAPTVHKVMLRAVMDRARYGTARSPAERMKQRKLRELLGMAETDGKG